MPEISIITVCYNSEKTIERTLKAMLAQDFEDYEYLIIDGKSTDGTLEILKEYEPKFQGRMQIFSEPDEGIYDAMNKGIRKAKGSLIGMVNSDDYYESGALGAMHEAYMQHHCEHVIFYGMQRRLRNAEEIEIEFIHDRILGEAMICHPTCFVTKKVYEDFGVYDTQYRSAADLDFLVRIKRQTDTLFVPVYRIISNFELGGMSASGRGAREAARIRCKYGIYSKARCDYVIFQSRITDMVHKIKRRRSR